MKLLLKKNVLKNNHKVDKNIKKLLISKRHGFLNTVIKDIKPLVIYKRLIIITTLNKNKDIELFKIFREDAKYIKKLYINK
jgi:hypothetical protein